MSNIVVGKQGSIIQGRFGPGGVRAPLPFGTAPQHPGAGGNALQLPKGFPRSQSNGQPLSVITRAKLERFFEADFSDVRVHIGMEALSIGATAFTMDSRIYFAPGHYNPNTTDGLALLGHELTHVLQQRAGLVSNPFGQGLAVVVNPDLEAEADRLGLRAAQFRPWLGKGTREKPGDGASVSLLAPSWLDGASGAPLEGREVPGTPRVIQRFLDSKYDPAGQTSNDKHAQCADFARIVSKLVDQAYAELLTGSIADWKGAKIATFLDLLYRDSPVAKTHAANAIEERVYALMKERVMPLPWTPQISDAMGSVSRPDIVVEVARNAFGLVTQEALIDITSERGHILRKAGGWFTSTRYVYIAEAYFDSITTADVANIKKAIACNGISLDDARRLKEESDARREELKQETAKKTLFARAMFNKAGNFSTFAKKHFAGKKSHASKFLLLNHVKRKGMYVYKGRRKLSPEAQAARIKKAREANKLKKQEEALRKKVVPEKIKKKSPFKKP